jgi:DNA polymerase elongation subunit (family B)
MPLLTFKEYQTRDDKISRQKYLKNHQFNKKVEYFHPTDVWDQTYTNAYQIALYGVIPSGQKAKLVINGVMPSFDIRIPKDFRNNQETFNEVLNEILEKKGLKYHKCELIKEQKYYTGFSRPKSYIRLYFLKLLDRNAAITELKKDYKIGNDDGGNFRAPHNGYPLKAARETNLLLSGWNKITKFTVIKSSFPLVLEIDIENIISAPDYEQSLPVIIAYCDAETEKFDKNVDGLPNPENAGDEMFIITTTFCRPNTLEKLDNLTICQFKGHNADELKKLINGSEDLNDNLKEAQAPSRGPKNDFVITCSDEREMLEAFIEIYGAVLPDFWIDFNGINFDQNYFYHRLKRYNDIARISDEGNIIYKFWKQTKSWIEETDDESKAMKYASGAPIYYTLLDKFYNKICAAYENKNRPFFDLKNRKHESYQWKKHTIKISAEKNEFGYSFIFPGMFYIDARIIMMKCYPTDSESSLKFYLKKLNLPPKKDMPANAMWMLFEDPTKPAEVGRTQYTLQELIDYASWDAESCQAIFNKQEIFTTRIASAALTEVSLYDEFYRAGGMKARNMLMSYGFKGVRDINGRTIPMIFSLNGETTADDEQDNNFGGGYVLSPKFNELGRAELPVAPHDFSSLYPGIMMTMNICYSTAIRDPKKLEKYKNLGYKFREIPFTLGKDNRPYTTWFLEYKLDDNLTPGSENGMGVLPTILSDLKAARDRVKKQEGEVSALIDDYIKEGKDTSELYLKKSVLKGKQLAIKVQMNTFYGELGNKNSPFPFVDLAACITAYGQESLKFVINFVENKGFYVHYGDTDSVYSSANKETYRELLTWYEKAAASLENNSAIEDPPMLSQDLEKWAIKQTKGNTNALIPVWGTKQTDLNPDIFNYSDANISMDTRRRLLKEELNRRMVITAQYCAKVLEAEINAALIIRTGTKRMSVAYEEVLYPVCFFGKKKYVGVQNVEPDVRLVGFDWSKKQHKFVRGLDFIKRGMAPIMREIGEEVICKFLDIMEMRSVREVVNECIKTFVDRKWKFEGFIKSAEYKPDKKNIAVLNAVKRWREEGKPVPLRGERFYYVYVKRSDKLSEFGRLIKLSAADKMEIPEIVIEHKLEIDIDAYMTGSIVGLLARFISYDDEFRKNHCDVTVNENEEEDDEEIDIDDKKAIAAASKVISKLIKLSKGEPEVSTNEAKATKKKEINAIRAQLPVEYHAGYNAYVDFLDANDRAAVNKKEKQLFIDFIRNDISDRISKCDKNNLYSVKAKAFINNLLRVDLTSSDIYELYFGSKYGEPLSIAYKKIISDEIKIIYSNMNENETSLNNIESLIMFSKYYNDLYLSNQQLNIIKYISMETFNFRTKTF